MNQYNLIDEKWIPVQLLDGGRTEFGLHDTLSRAREIAGIEDSSPLITAALHRLLLALLYRALEGPTDFDQAKEILKSGLPMDRIDAYLEKWRSRFKLFDEHHPFGQSPNLPESTVGSWTRLTADRNPNTNKVLFDHTDSKNPEPATPAECARWIVSTMHFSIAGGRGFFPSPTANAMLCIPLGENLQDTLCRSLVPYGNRLIQQADSAIWEREPIKLPLVQPKRTCRGMADLYTWQPRLVLLIPQEDNTIIKVRFAPGEGIENTILTIDPMAAYVKDEARGLFPIKFKASRGTWRDYDSLIPDASGLAPLTIQHAIRLANRNPAKLPQSIMVLGLNYQPPNAIIEFWRMESFKLPEAVAGPRGLELRSVIHDLLGNAAKAESSIWKACRSYARCLLSRGDREPAKEDVHAFIGHMMVISRYWSILESRFHDLLDLCTVGSQQQEIEIHWFEAMREALKEAWSPHRADAMQGDAWSIRALAKAEIFVFAIERWIDDCIVELTSSKEVL